MPGLFKKRPSQTPAVCGGTNRTIDENAPKNITSEIITCFDVRSKLPYDINNKAADRLSYIAAFAAKCSFGTLVCLQKEQNFEKSTSASGFFVVKEDILTPLALLVKKHNIALKNGFHSFTSGLPQNFGGDINILYESGEKISISDNQTSVLSRPAAEDICQVFEKAMSGECAVLPGADSISDILFEEKSPDGSFSRILFRTDGSTGVVIEDSRYQDQTSYHNEKPADIEKTQKILSLVSQSSILAWAGLPERTARASSDKTLTFTFNDGSSIVVSNNTLLPPKLSAAFFNIQLEISKV